MSLTAIPLQFEKYLQNQISVGNGPDMNEMIFAYIPDLDLTQPIDRSQGLPDVSLWVHQQDIDQVGKLGDNALVYSVVIPGSVDAFTFNAIYLRDKNVPNSCGMVVHKADETKENGMASTKSLMQQYTGAAQIAGIDVDAATWQIDYQARLLGIEDDMRLANVDTYGHAAFVDGFEVVQQADPTKYAISPGVAYVGGLRAVLDDEIIQTINTKPNGLYLDVVRMGTALSQWQNVVTVRLSPVELSDYVDGSNQQHFVAKLAGINADGSVADWRVKWSDGNPHPQYLKKTEKALAANIADTIGVTNLNRASSGVVTITSAAWFGAQPIGLSSMVQLNNAYLPVSVGSGYGYIFKLNARDISGGSAWLFMDNIKPPTKLWLGIAHDTASSPTWVSLYSSGNLPAISNVVGLSDALSGLSQSLQDHANALDPHHYYDEGRNYSRGEIVTIVDNGYLKQFLCNQAHESNAAANPIDDDSDTWRQYPFKEINNANGRAFLYADGTCVQFGTYTHNQGAGSVERSFPVPFTSTKSILPGSFTDGGGATYLCGISFVGLSGYRTAINVYFSPAGTMYTNSTNNTPLISWVALGRWAEEV